MSNEAQPERTEESKMESITKTTLEDAWEQRCNRYAEGAKLWVEGAKLRAEGDKLWAEGIIEVYGPREPIDWSEYPSCIVRGVRYGASP
jgi:hypothetical protein